jgi:hypothetical protein
MPVCGKFYLRLSLLGASRIPCRMKESQLQHAAATPMSTSTIAVARPSRASDRFTATSALKAHWPEYLMESAELGFFMVSACFFTTVLEYPASPVRHMLPNPFLRQAVSGLAMALTLLLLIHSTWGKRSGAHMNPGMAFSTLFSSLRAGSVVLSFLLWL